MTQALQGSYINQGATLATIDDRVIPLSFGNDVEAYQAVQSTVALVDRSHWGRIVVSDSDRLRFLHNQTTHDFQSRQPGEGCDTVFVTSTARTVDLVSAYVKADSVLLLTSPGQVQKLIDWMDRYIFFADKVKLANVTAETVAFSLIGPAANACLAKLGWSAIAGKPPSHHQTVSLGDVELTLAVGSGLASPGYTLIAPVEHGEQLWQDITAAGAVPTGETVWERLRIEQGRPMPEKELTEDYNPLEAGLWDAISFNKGCYIGQETIARLNTYQGVKQQLWGLHLNGNAPTGSPITFEGNKVGVLTSLIETPAGWRGLGYIRTKAGGNGLTVEIGDGVATVVDLPFISRDYWAGNSG
ncbi:MAG: folate-binding protein [Cyanobacteria bacterium P01_A01_bin.123]